MIAKEPHVDPHPFFHYFISLTLSTFLLFFTYSWVFASEPPCDGRTHPPWKHDQDISWLGETSVKKIGSTLLILPMQFGNGTLQDLLAQVDSLKTLNIGYIQLSPIQPQSAERVMLSPQHAHYLLETLGLTDLFSESDNARDPIAYFPNKHGYWPQVGSWGKVNPQLGSRQTLKLLAQALKASGIGLGLDVVMNHVGHRENPDLVLLRRARLLGQRMSIRTDDARLFFQRDEIASDRWGWLDLSAHQVSSEHLEGGIQVGHMMVRLDRNAIQEVCQCNLHSLSSIKHSPYNKLTRAALQGYGEIIHLSEPDFIRMDAAKHLYASDLAYFIRSLASYSDKPISFFLEYLYPAVQQLPILAARLQIVKRLAPGIEVNVYDFVTGHVLRRLVKDPQSAHAVFKELYDMEVDLDLWGKMGPMVVEDHDLAVSLQKNFSPTEHRLIYELAYALSTTYAPLVHQSLTQTRTELDQEYRSAIQQIRDGGDLLDPKGMTYQRGHVSHLKVDHVNAEVIRHLNTLREWVPELRNHPRTMIQTGQQQILHFVLSGGNGRHVHILANLSDQVFEQTFPYQKKRTLLYESPQLEAEDPFRYRFNEGMGEPLEVSHRYSIPPKSLVMILEEEPDGATMAYRIEERLLVVDNNVIYTAPTSIEQVVPKGDDFLVRFAFDTNTPGTSQANLVRVDAEGTVLWEVSPPNARDPGYDDCFELIRHEEDHYTVTTFRGVVYDLDPDTGELSNGRFTG